MRGRNRRKEERIRGLDLRWPAGSVRHAPATHWRRARPARQQPEEGFGRRRQPREELPGRARGRWASGRACAQLSTKLMSPPSSPVKLMKPPISPEKEAQTWPEVEDHPSSTPMPPTSPQLSKESDRTQVEAKEVRLSDMPQEIYDIADLNIVEDLDNRPSKRAKNSESCVLEPKPMSPTVSASEGRGTRRGAQLPAAPAPNQTHPVCPIWAGLSTWAKCKQYNIHVIMVKKHICSNLFGAKLFVFQGITSIKNKID